MVKVISGLCMAAMVLFSLSLPILNFITLPILFFFLLTNLIALNNGMVMIRFLISSLAYFLYMLYCMVNTPLMGAPMNALGLCVVLGYLYYDVTNAQRSKEQIRRKERALLAAGEAELDAQDVNLAPPVELTTAELRERFKNSTQREQDFLKHIPLKDRARVHALKKQATLGDNTESRPSFIDFFGCATWDAWKPLAGMPRLEAMRQHIALVDDLIV